MRLKKGAIIAGGMALAMALGVALPGVATADVAPIHVSGTNGDGVIIHERPSKASKRLGWIPEGAVPRRDCAVIAEYVGNVRFWFHVTYNGVPGYIPSYYDDSRYKDMADLTAKYGIPACGTAPPSIPVEQPNTSTWNTDAARQWALAHARDPQPFDSACAHFVSQAFWAGGLPRTAEWTDKGFHGRLQRRPGTGTATEVNLLRAYLMRTYHVQQLEITDRFAPNATVPEARPGDVIVYDMDNDGRLNHAGLVVGFAQGTQYPEISQWGQCRCFAPWVSSLVELSEGWLDVLDVLQDVDSEKCAECASMAAADRRSQYSHFLTNTNMRVNLTID